MRPSKSILTASLLAASLLPGAAAEPNADQLLRQMSAKLAAARIFSFEAKREIDAALLAEHDVRGKINISALVQRPNKLVARAVTREGMRKFVFDGRTLSLLDAEKHCYAAVPMRTTIDGLVDVLDEKFGFTPPLAEFALSNPYKDFRREAHTVTYLGQGKTGGVLGIGGVECHRIGLKGKLADAELWIAIGDQLPRRLVATFHADGHPQLRIDFLQWNLTAPVSATDFSFTPPQGAQRIEMWTTAKMQMAQNH
jgi:hypothetical protein